MNYNPEIFKAYDIRGKYGEDFEKEFGRSLGYVVAKHLQAKTIVVARDMRPSSDELSSQVIEGIKDAGCDVIDIGMTSTPLFYFGVINEKADGGVMITASHLGDEFNGFKVARAGAVTIGGDDLLNSAKELFDGEIEESEKGSVEMKDLLQVYTDVVIGHSGLQKGDILTPIALEGNKMVLKEAMSVMNALEIQVVEGSSEITFEFDPDADRLVIKDAKKQKVRGDLVGGMMAGNLFPNGKIAYDLRYSRGVLAYLDSMGIEVIPSRIGHTLIKAIMRENELEFCGEQSGHMFFKEMGYVEASTLAILKILKIMKDTGKTIEELVEPVNQWSTTEEINFDFEKRQTALDLIEKTKEKYSDAKINDTDGIRVEYEDWGFLLRPSNTEAKLRLIVDAKTSELMEQKKEELSLLLK